MPNAYFYSSTAGSYTLTGSITNSATSLVLSSVTGLPSSTPYKLVIDPGQGTEEIVKVTGIAGLTLTVTRGHDGSAASAHAGGAVVRHMMTAEDLTLSRTHEAATSGVHGLAGALVGLTDAQALTNKDLTSGTNSFPSSLATLAGAQTLTNKDLSSGTNIFPAALATDAELSSHSSATVVHGATGAVVGTTNTQTLTNKDLSSGTNTFPASLATDAELAAYPATATYTPTISSVTTSASTGRYWRAGGRMFFEVDFTVSAAPTGTVSVSLPLATASYPTVALRAIAQGVIKDVSAGLYLPVYGIVQDFTTPYNSVTLMVPTSTTNGSLSFLAGAVPWAWASGDTVSISGSYPI